MKIRFTTTFLLFFVALFFLTSSYADEMLGYSVVDNISHIFLWSLVFVPISFFALVLNIQKYKFWLKFTGIFFAISMAIVFLVPEYDPAMISVDRELVNWFFIGLYSLISIIYFIVQYFKNKKYAQ